MKKVYTISMAVMTTLIMSETFGQAILLDDNHNLSGFVFNGKIILTSHRDSTFWESNGTPSGTQQFSTVKSDLNGMGAIGNLLYFAGLNATNGAELWSTNGTTGGTVLTSDIWAGPDSSKPDNFILFNNKLYFTAYTSALGRELYQYTGTGSPTNVIDLNSGSGSGFDNIQPGRTRHYINNNTLFFNAYNGSGNALYGMQGTTVTKLLDFVSGDSLKSFSYIGNTTFFMLSNGQNNLKLYKTDGTPGGTTLVKSFAGMIIADFGLQMINWNNKIYFSAAESGLDNELWSTDGTITQEVADINPGASGSFPFIYNSVVLQNKLIFAARTDDSGIELWSTDGTALNTSMLLDIKTEDGEGSSPVLWPVFSDKQSVNLNEPFNRSANYNGYIFFVADDGIHGKELWKTDGTALNTLMVKDLNPSGDGADVSSYMYTKEGIIFSGDDGTNGLEPWISNGTDLGTTGIANINLSGDSYPFFYFIWNGDIYLNADNGNGGAEEYFDFYKLQGPFSPLPVTLGDLTANVLPNSVSLRWNTSSENNSDRFIVLRSLDGNRYSEIGTVQAAGSSNSLRNYSFNDLDAYNLGVSKLYYRLNMKDKDGKSYFSKIEMVTLIENAADLIIYPNPVNDFLKIKYNTKSQCNLSISDLNGKIVYSTEIDPSANGLHIVYVSSFAKGSYVVKLSDGTFTRIGKFIKK